MDMKRAYYEDIEFFKSGVILFWTIVFLAVLFTIPLYFSDYSLYLLNLIMVYIIVSVGLNILVGSTGQISLGHAPFFGGRAGLMAPPLDLGIKQLGLSLVLVTETSKYYLVLTFTILMVLFAINILKTKAGRAFVAIRDSDIAAEVIGINLTMFKTLSFAVSAFYAGIAGGLFAFVLGFFDPFTFNLILSIIFIVMIVVGGLGSVMGSITGAALITYLMYDLFKNVDEVPYVGSLLVMVSERWMTVTGMDNFNYIALGLVMIGIMLFEPLGIFGAWIRIKKYWKTWPF